MTAQWPDRLHWQGETHTIIGVSGDNLPTPQDFGLHVMMWNTACYRGYVAIYALVANVLHLNELRIGHLAEDGEWAAINGISPEPIIQSGMVLRNGKEQFETWQDGNQYADLDRALDFTGALLIGAGYVSDPGLHWDFPLPYHYQAVHDLRFAVGSLHEVTEYSGQAAVWRAGIQQAQQARSAQINALQARGLSYPEIIRQMEPPPSRRELAGETWHFLADYRSLGSGSVWDMVG